MSIFIVIHRQTQDSCEDLSTEQSQSIVWHCK